MDLNELSETIERDFSYPVTSVAVVEAIGDRTVDAPDADDAETLRTVIGRSGVERYETPDALITTIRGNVSDDYVGRKYYDDRGATLLSLDDQETESRNESF